jgi:hypothetical protein
VASVGVLGGEARAETPTAVVYVDVPVAATPLPADAGDAASDPTTVPTALPTTDDNAGEPTAATATAGAAEATATAVPTATVVAAQASTCTYKCPFQRHCSFPGRCGRYRDSNGNGQCDLGECA